MSDPPNCRGDAAAMQPPNRDASFLETVVRGYERDGYTPSFHLAQ